MTITDPRLPPAGGQEERRSRPDDRTPLRDRGPHGERGRPAPRGRTGASGHEPLGAGKSAVAGRSALLAEAAARMPAEMLAETTILSRSRAGVRTRQSRFRQNQGLFYALCSVVGVLSLIGLVMVLSASSVLSLRNYGTPWYYFEHQLVWLLLGSAAFVIGVKVDPVHWRRFARLGMWVSLAMLVAVLVPHVGMATAGASRWLGRGSIQIQPSEVAKLAFVFFAADVIDRRADRGTWTYQMGPVLAILVLLVLLVMKQPDMGTTVVLVLIGFAILLTAGMPTKPIVKMVAVALALGGLLAVISPYRLRRLTSFVHPEANAQGSGYQAVQALAGLSDGGLLGHGLGSSIASWGFLPNAQTDFIFAVIGEETGLVGSVAVAGLFVMLAVVGIKISCRCRDRYLALVAAGIVAWLCGQAVINIGAVVGLLPVTGVPLPFVSFGGSSLVIALFGTGVLAAVAKRA
jgi:cell division protein FtsW